MTVEEQIRNLLMSDRLEEAVQAMRSVASGTYYDNDTLLLMARWSRLQKQMNNGLISQTDYNLEGNRLRVSALHTLDLLLREVPERLKGSPAQSAHSGKQPFSNEMDYGHYGRANEDKQVQTRPVRLFISYSHKDETFKEELQAHLSPLRLSGKIKDWSVFELKAGAKWDSEIKWELATTDIVLYLISASFLQSEYIRKVEVPYVIERHKKDDVVMVPILIRPCDVESTFFYRLHGLPEGFKPISKWEDRDEAWLNVVKGIKKLIQSERFQVKA